MAVISLKDLLNCLDVEQTGPETWTGRNLELPGGYRIFGGQLLAQAISIGGSPASMRRVLIGPRAPDLSSEGPSSRGSQRVAIWISSPSIRAS